MQELEKSQTELPKWYLEVPAPQRHAGFHARAGTGQLFYCARGTAQLIVSFGNVTDTDHPEQDWAAWTDRFATPRHWSHLALLSDTPNWFRDPAVIKRLQKLRDDGFFTGFEAVTFFGATPEGGSFAALAFAPLCPGATVIALSPQTTLNSKKAPWESRFEPAAAGDWSLPYSDAAAGLAKVSRAYVVYDPFARADKRHAERLPARHVMALRGFGMASETAVALRRINVLGDLVEQAVAGTLEPAVFYQMIRARKDAYIYRRIMEAHLEARGKDALRAAFTKAFRQRSRQRKIALEQQKKTAEMSFSPAPLMDLPPPKRPNLAARRYPRSLGNVWGLQDDGTSLRYLSDQYRGVVMGYEERNRLTLAETPPLALGMLAFGHGVAVERPLPEPFNWHVVDEELTGKIPAFGAKAQGVVVQRLAARHHHAYRTIVALSEPQAGITAAEALPDSPRYQTAMRRISAARTALAAWDKSLFMDRISLSLLAGAPDTPLQDAIRHYGTVAQHIRHDAAVAAGQASLPHVIVSQSAGTATDGRSEVILAEGQLDLAHPALGIIVATPKYPFALMAQMPATHDPQAQMLIDELEALALAHVHDNQRWYCPSLRQAYLRGQTVVAEFSALSDLVLGQGVHGFALAGCTNGASITDVQLRGTTAYLSCDKAPKGRDLSVTYAWGAQDPKGGGRAANQGALRDSWAQPSVLLPEQTLHRHALSGRVRVLPSDLPSDLPKTPEAAS